MRRLRQPGLAGACSRGPRSPRRSPRPRPPRSPRSPRSPRGGTVLPLLGRSAPSSAGFVPSGTAPSTPVAAFRFPALARSAAFAAVTTALAGSRGSRGRAVASAFAALARRALFAIAPGGRPRRHAAVGLRRFPAVARSRRGFAATAIAAASTLALAVAASSFARPPRRPSPRPPSRPSPSPRRGLRRGLRAALPSCGCSRDRRRCRRGGRARCRTGP